LSWIEEGREWRPSTIHLFPLLPVASLLSALFLGQAFRNLRPAQCQLLKSLGLWLATLLTARKTGRKIPFGSRLPPPR
jgi:hypothetical protein